MAKTDILFPVGRLLKGSLYKPQDKDADGKPLVIKSGPNAGQPTVKFYFALGIPKGTEKHWAETAWGAKMWAIGHAAFPQQAQSPSFAWKVIDGDSTLANTKGTKPCDSEGFPGHWVVSFSSSFAPKIYGDGGKVVFTEPDQVKLGHYVQVLGTVDSNGSTQRPGLFVNHSMVCFIEFGPVIHTGPDAASVGFEAQRSTMPSGGFTPPVPPASTGIAPPVPMVPAATPVTPAAPPVTPVVPNPAILTQGLPHAVPASPAVVMLPAAGANTYESFIAAGWTHAQLVQNGFIAG